MALAETTIPEWTLGDRLAKARSTAGLTQAAWGEKLNVSSATVAAWETDRNRPRDLAGIATQIEELTGIDPAWLLGFRTGSFTPLYGLPSTPMPELPFPTARRQLVAVGSS